MVVDAEILGRLLARRTRHLPPDTTCLRWVDGELPGIAVDLFGDVAVLSLYSEFAEDDERAVVGALAAAHPLRAIYLKRRPKEARRRANEDALRVAPPTPAFGPPVPSLEVLEQGARFEIRPGNGLSVGLYLDARDVRARVRDIARGRRVLNTFAYTCGFGVAARLGGAERVVNLDVSRKVLDWGQANYRLNHLDAERVDFVSGDAFDWLARFQRKGNEFDLVILDPPGFSTAGQRRFSASKDYHRLIAAAAEVEPRGGLMVVMCNVESMAEEVLRAHLDRGLSGRRFRIVEHLASSRVDFSADGALKCLLVELGSR
jgi:23S rRNA (cytosine1962-C5)-methyltransferase